jgi:hypothetical protein
MRNQDVKEAGLPAPWEPINDRVTFLSLRTGTLRLRVRVRNTPDGEVCIRSPIMCFVKEAYHGVTATPEHISSRCAVLRKPP